MATNTAILALIKQVLGENPGAWHTALNANFDKLDTALGQSVVGNPNTVPVEALWVGQRLFQPSAVAWWVATAPGIPPTGVWQREIPQGTIVAYSGAVAAIPAGWLLCDGSGAVIDGQAVATPNLSGRFIVGHSITDPDFDASPSGYLANKTGGAKTVTLTAGNLPAVTLTTTSEVVSTPVGTRSFDSGGPTALVPAGSGTPTNIDAIAHDHEVTLNPGAPTAIDKLPPYFALAWIMKV